MDIATTLKRLRRKNGFSQDHLAQKVGTKLSAISRWEKGTVKPNLEMATKLAAALGVSMDVFCGISVSEVSELEKLAKKASKLPEPQVAALEVVLKRFLDNGF